MNTVSKRLDALRPGDVVKLDGHSGEYPHKRFPADTWGRVRKVDENLVYRTTRGGRDEILKITVTLIDLNTSKVWIDKGDAHDTRPTRR